MREGGRSKEGQENESQNCGRRASRMEGRKGGVLVLAGIELIFFLVAGIVLCFGFSVRIMLITR